MSDREIVEVPIDGTLDLHTFAPQDVKDLVADYVDETAARGFDEIRVIHGKGTGALRAAVRTALAQHPLVRQVVAAGASEGGDGATVVTL